MTSNTAVRLLCLLLCFSSFLKRAFAQDGVSEIDFTPMMRGFDSMGELQDHRQLSSWGTWSNLFFAIGVCSSDGCECGEPHGPLCGCPHCDCSRSGPQPPFCHKICNTGCSSSGSSSSTSSSGGTSYENVADAEDTTENKGEGQTPTLRKNWWLALAAAAGVAAAGFGVMAVRKRRQTATAKSLSEDNDGATASDYALMGGVSAAFAGIMSRMGLSANDGSDSSTASDGSSGVVSRRMNLLKNGDDVVPLEGPNPKFIAIPKTFIPDPLPVEEGIEVSGPSRPSSHYAV